MERFWHQVGSQNGARIDIKGGWKNDEKKDDGQDASKMVSGWKMSGKLEWAPAAELPVWGGVRSARTLVRIVLAENLSRLAAILWMARRI